MTIDKSMIKRFVTQIFPHGGDKYFDYEEEFDALCRAIEAAVLPEGWVAVPKEPTLAMLDCLRADITSNLEKRYQAMLAAAPKAQEGVPFKATVIFDDCTKIVEGVMPAQAEKQEPVKITDGMAFAFAHAISDASLSQDDVEEIKTGLRAAFADISEPEPVKNEPVAWMVVTSDDKLIFQNASQAEHYAEKWELVSAPLYTRPQPDLTAEVERLREEAWELRRSDRRREQVMLALHREAREYKQRIAALEEAAREALEALQYKLHVVEAIAKLDAVLGNV